MFKFLKKLFHRHKHLHHQHGEVRIGNNWFYHKSIPNPDHPEFEEQKKICMEVIKDLTYYGLLQTHCHTWQISRDVHIPSLRYYLCAMNPEYKFRVHCERKRREKFMNVTIYVDYAKASPISSRLIECMMMDENYMKQQRIL